MENKKILNEDQLSEISGGTSGNNPQIVEFQIKYSATDSRSKIRDMVRQQLERHNVPKSVITRIGFIDQRYLSFGSGCLGVTWQEGWHEPKYTKIHD